MHAIRREEQIPVRGKYDVVVVGGGIAGVAAAIAAARQGARTLIVEKSVMLGGLATLGYIVIYLPLCDGNGRRLIGGVAEELLWLSIKNSYDTLPDAWRTRPARADTAARYRTEFNGPAFAFALDAAVQDAGVSILFDTLFCGVEMDGNRCTHVLFENKDGRTAYACDVVIDATGDASVAAAAGCDTKNGTNYLAYWGYYTDSEAIRAAFELDDVSKSVKMMKLGHCSGKDHPAHMRLVSGTTAEDINEFVIEGHKLAASILAERGPTRYAVTGLPAMPQLRTSRMIQGQYALKYSEAGAYFEDSIGCCGDWRKPGICFEIPYRTLCAPSCRNLLTVGRSISCGDTEAWEVTRVIPVAALTGEAAGFAAAHAANGDVFDVDTARIQQYIAGGGTAIHL